MAETKTCACGCGKTFVVRPKFATQKFALASCSNRVAEARRRKQYHARPHRGRVCRYCAGTDAEVNWFHGMTDVCPPCDRARTRNPCRTCDGPTRRGLCPTCSPAPEGMVKVIVVDEATDRERVVYRTPVVSVAGRKMSVSDETPVVTLPSKAWARLRA
jgi:hypothetical protein